MYQPPRRHKRYLALLLIIIAGVAVGNLISAWIMTQVVEQEVAKAATDWQRAMKALTQRPKPPGQGGR